MADLRTRHFNLIPFFSMLCTLRILYMEVRFAAAGKFHHILTMGTVLFSLVAVLAVVILTCHGCLEEEARSLLLFRKRMLDLNTSKEISGAKRSRKRLSYFPTWKEGSDYFSTWKEGTDCCKKWKRVVCNPLTHHVQRLDFHRETDDPLTHKIAADYPFAIQDCETLLPLSNLHGLTSLDMEGNSVDMEGNSLNVSLVLACLGRFPSLSEIKLRTTQPGSSISSAFQEWPSEALQRLTSLDLDNNFLSGNLPPQLRNMTSLAYLDLSGNNFNSDFHELQNMTSLAYLDLSGNNFNSDFHELRGLSNLRHLLLSALNPDKVTWSAWNFSRLVELRLQSCSLKQHHIEQMKWLQLNKGMEYLFLDYNMLTDISFIGHFPHLRELYASHNSIEGGIPQSIGNMMNLQVLSLGSSNLVGRIPEPIGNMMKLQTLDLGTNNLVGRIPMSLGNLSLLASLDLSNNSLSGSIPYTISKLSRLLSLDVSYNQLNESSSLLSLPSSLQVVDLKENQMNGTVSEYLFSNLTKVYTLDLTESGLSINISKTWIPNFSCMLLLLGSCKINGPFPEWISAVLGLDYLDLSNTGLYGQIPPWLWELPAENGLSALNLSCNELQGHVPHLGRFHVMDLSFNKLNGPLPALLTSSKGLGDEDLGSLYLDFKYNSFEGPLPTDVRVQVLAYLDASNNKLTGTIPSIYSNCSSLEFLNLANNNLNGSLPIQFGSNLQSLQSLILFNNSLEGELPESLSGCSKLRVLNIGNNFFHGQFPKSISQLKQLRILEMKSNKFNGNVPEDLNTMLYLHFIDVSSNQFFGPIPKSIFALPGMLNEMHDPSSENISSSDIVGEPGTREFLPIGITTFQGIQFNAKGLYLLYPHILSALTCIDLSNNHFIGEIPRDLDKLKGLKLLNLSRNHLTGPIPASIGKMTGLEQLDLSSNKFSGSIPNEFVGLNSMGFLNLSSNNLSGRIPRGGQMLTFGPQYFEENPNLIDPLLLLDKKRHTEAQTVEESEESGGHDQEFWWAISVGVSFGVGFAAFVSAWVLEGRFRKYVNSCMDPIILWLFRSRY